MSLQSGKYLARVEREVIVWPAPDANGDGPVVERPVYNGEGHQVSRAIERDANGRPVREYSCPKGFQEFTNSNRDPYWVMVDDRGQVKRQPNGEAINIAPGQALVLYPDGSVEQLADWQQFVFADLNQLVTDDTDKSATVVGVPDEVSDVAVVDKDARIAELEAKLAAAGVA